MKVKIKGERNISDRIQDREGDESGAGQGQGQGGDKSNDGGSCISPRLSSLDNRSAFSCYIGRLCFVLFHFMNRRKRFRRWRFDLFFIENEEGRGWPTVRVM